MEKIMAQKKKTKAMVVSQEKLADGIYDLRLETELAQDAACGQFVGVYPLSLIHISEPTRPY